MAILLVGCSASSGTRLQSTTADGDVVTTYDDPKYGMRLTYPGDWQEQSIPFMVRPRGTIIVLVGRAELSENRMPPTISVTAQASAQAAPDALARQSIDKARKQFGDFRLIESNPASLAGEPARRIVYTGSKLGVSLEVMNVIAVHAGKAFGITYSADPQIFAEHMHAAQGVIDSVQWAK